MNPRAVGISILAALAGVVVGCMIFFGSGLAKTSPVSAPLVSDVSYGLAYGARTELCVKPDGEVARNWIFTNRWMKNQLSFDTYTVDGRVYNALHIVTDDPNLPARSVRFRKVIVNIGDGPSLEGHSYLSTLINGSPAKMERELLFVEFNGRLERQRRPLPACGTPRS